MLALGNNEGSNARAAGHFRPAILSDCDIAWSVTCLFVQILSVDRPLYLSLQGHCRKSDITDESLMLSVDGFIG